MVTKSWKPLFAFLANHIHRFLQANDPDVDSLSHRPRNDFRRLGFTFSFTVHQTSINTGTLIRWDKGFDIPSAIGRDPCTMLQEELDAVSAPVLVTALVNDSVATYVAQQYVCGGRAVLGGIFGTGTNGAYLEDLADVGKIQDSSEKSAPSTPPDHVVVNTEWGGLDDHAQLLPTVQYDLDLDQSSLHPGEQRYEKMLSGMYLGELFRRAVLAAYEHDFRHQAFRTSSPLFHPWQIPTSLLSLLAGDDSDGYTESREALQSTLELESLTMEEVQGIRMIAAAVSKRAARLAGIATCAVILKTGSLRSPSSAQVHSGAKAEPSLITQEQGGGIPVSTHMYRLLSKFTQRSWPSLADLQRCVYWKESPSPSKDDSEGGGPIYIGLDGTLAASSPGFVAGIRSTFRDIAGIGEEGDRRIRITLLQDASSVGTALVAQAAG
jgi:hexokinase